MKNYKVILRYELEVKAENQLDAKEKMTDYLNNVELSDNLTVTENKE